MQDSFNHTLHRANQLVVPVLSRVLSPRQEQCSQQGLYSPSFVDINIEVVLLKPVCLLLLFHCPVPHFLTDLPNHFFSLTICPAHCSFLSFNVYSDETFFVVRFDSL